MFKKLFCIHKTEHIATHKRCGYRISLRQCKKCGKYFAYDKMWDSYTRLKNIDWEEWEGYEPNIENCRCDNG